MRPRRIWLRFARSLSRGMFLIRMCFGVLLRISACRSSGLGVVQSWRLVNEWWLPNRRVKYEVNQLCVAHEGKIAIVAHIPTIFISVGVIAITLVYLKKFLLLGAVPFPKDVPRLKELGVGGVITLNESYETLVPTFLYSAHDIDHLVIPTRAYLFAPSFFDIDRAVKFIDSNATSGKTTYVHCKAANRHTFTITAGKSSILLDVKPWDDETGMQKLEEAVRSVQMEGLLLSWYSLLAFIY